MKVKLKGSLIIVAGKTYSRGDVLEVSESVYNSHITKFEKVANEKKPDAQIVTNDKPKKKKQKKVAE